MSICHVTVVQAIDQRKVQKPFNFTKSEIENRLAQIKLEEGSARKRSLKLYMEVSGWLRKEASTYHSKITKWIAKKYPEVKNPREFHKRGEGRVLHCESNSKLYN